MTKTCFQLPKVVPGHPGSEPTAERPSAVIGAVLRFSSCLQSRASPWRGLKGPAGCEATPPPDPTAPLKAVLLHLLCTVSFSRRFLRGASPVSSHDKESKRHSCHPLPVRDKKAKAKVRLATQLVGSRVEMGTLKLHCSQYRALHVTCHPLGCPGQASQLSLISDACAG